ncbi:MAG: triose-phosphate isomerase [Chitinophagales bacterium]|nr:triose-phosphate isomerase [Chitinophagales bacterium]
MRQKIVAGNWKMNTTLDEGIILVKECLERIDGPADNTKVILVPPFYLLKDAVLLVKGRSSIHVGAQNCYEADSGAFTGEISAPMIRSVGAEYVIVGHSERRKYFGDTDERIARKIDSVLKEGLSPIFCCGEELPARQSDQQENVVENQIRKALYHLNGDQLQRVIIAYEPVWAIGTGQTASPQQAQDMHAFIRDLLARLFTQEIADEITILYGGSCKPSNAEELFAQKDVDGGLIGGASLNANDFSAIVKEL